MPIRVELRVPAAAPYLDAALEGLVLLDVAYLQRHRVAPLYRAGVRYRREATGRERWLTIPELYAARAGDCEDLGAARAAELRVAGCDAYAFARRTGRRTWHTLVWCNGRVEDPARKLGMKGRA